eukprot:2204334-Prymnesium_polylepis.1
MKTVSWGSMGVSGVGKCMGAHLVSPNETTQPRTLTSPAGDPLSGSRRMPFAVHLGDLLKLATDATVRAAQSR